MYSYAVSEVIGEDERERLILEHLPQVRLIARRIQERLPENISLEDLVSTGVIGLISAIDNFDPSHNVKLKPMRNTRSAAQFWIACAAWTGLPGRSAAKPSRSKRPSRPPSRRLKRCPDRRGNRRSNWRFPWRSITNGWWRFAA